MKRMAASDVLIVGLSGLGVEIAKNVCLAGVKSVTLSDQTPVTIPDLGTQFFLRDTDVGQRRDEATRPRLAELNAYTPVSTLEQFTLDAVKRFTVVVLVQGSTAQQLELNAFTHANGIKFIAANTAGLFGSAFCDFGEQFPVVDTTGETPLSGMVVEIEEAEDALVTCLDETRHGLEDGDYVRFTEVEGLDINSDGVEGARKVTVVGALSFPACSVLSWFFLGGKERIVVRVELTLILRRSLYLQGRRHTWSRPVQARRMVPPGQDAETSRLRLSFPLLLHRVTQTHLFRSAETSLRVHHLS
jgi:molybdopterin/thiamine biosynthesis adenylyltransferase